MKLTPVERLMLLKLTQILEVIDPAHAAQHNADAEALEQGTPARIKALFDLIELEPVDEMPALRPVLRLVHSAAE